MSAKIFTVGYGGFNYATGSDRPGLLFWSGSFAMTGSGGTNETTNYTGLGFEIIRDTDNFLRFSTNPSQFEVRTQTFFLGGTNQFVSGSDSKIEISSSNFHLSNTGDVIMQGTITADAGNIGGFTISDVAIASTDENLVLSGSGQITASAGLIGGFTITDAALASTDGNLVLSGSGQITASAGQIGGFILESNRIKSFGHTPYLSGQGIFLQAPADGIQSEQMYPAFRVQEDGNDFTEMFISASKYGLRSHVAGNPVFELGSTNQIAGWTIDTEKIEKVSNDGGLSIDSTNNHISFRTGSNIDTVITTIGNLGSNVFGIKSLNSADTSETIFKLAEDGNEIAGWTITANTIHKVSSNGGVSIDSTENQINFRTGSNIDSSVVKIGDIGTNEFGILGLDSDDTSKTIFKLGETGNEIAGWSFTDLDITKINADGGVRISSYAKKLSFRTGSAEASEILHVGNLGGVNSIGANKYGILGLDSTDNTKTLFKLGEDGNEIAGWTISDTQLKGGNLVLDKAGKVFSDGFVSSTMPMAGTGFMLSVDDGTGASYLEVENARIRGTLSTAVFEKETVSAVGGQLLVANSTTISSESVVTPSDTTMSVANASGFVADEIILAKKVDGTGFNTEYMKIESASIDDTDSGQGRIMVERGFGQSLGAGSGSNPAPIGTTQAYSGSQVLVSTGRVNTGFIHLNANPSDAKTPYIDIVERTGSGLYDAKLAARLGDLSGIEDTKFSDGVTGYGLYTQNGYFSGKIEVASLPQAPDAEKLLGYYPLDSLNIIDASGRNTGSAVSSSAPTLVSHPAGFGIQHAGTGHAILPAVNGGSDLEVALGQSVWTMCFYFTPKSGFQNYNDVIRWNLDNTNDSGGGTTVTNKHARFERSNPATSDTTPSFQFLIQTADSVGDAKYVDLDFDDLPENQVQHIAIVCDIENNILRGYVNGVSQSAATFLASGATTVTSTTVGTSGLDFRLFPNTGNAGEVISELRIYTGSLSASEIEAIYLGNTQQGGGRTVIEGGQITTGVILSENYDSSNGSEIDLNAGTIKLGGSSSPLFQVKTDGTVTASKGLIGGINLESDKLFIGTGTHNNSNTQFYVEDDGKFSLGDKLSWDGSSLSINGDVTVTNAGDFADLNAHMSGSSFYENFQSTLDTTKFTTANLTQTLKSQGPGGTPYSGSMFNNSGPSGWTAGAIANTTFLRSQAVKMEVDILVNAHAAATMIGFVEAEAVQADISTATNWNHLEEGFYVNDDQIRVYSDHDNSGVAGATLQQIILDDDWVDGEDTIYRLVITLKPSGGARYEVYKNGDFTLPHGVYDTTGNTREQLKPAFFVYYAGASNQLTLGQMGVGIPLQATQISGNSISTGKIESNNLSTTQGTQIELDNEKILIGGTNAATEGIVLDGSTAGQPKLFVGNATSFIKFNHTSDKIEVATDNFSIDSSGNVSMSGNVTASGGLIGGWTIESDKLVDSSNKLKLEPAGTYIISASDFQVSTAGEVTASAGLIAGFTIDEGKMAKGTTFQLSASTDTTDLSGFISSSGFQVSPGGLVEASNFTEKTVTVTDSNKSQYLITTSGTGRNLAFDGSGGGEIIMNMIIDVSDTIVIKDILLPFTGSNAASVGVVLTNVATGVSFDDTSIQGNTLHYYTEIVDAPEA